MLGTWRTPWFLPSSTYINISAVYKSTRRARVFSTAAVSTPTNSMDKTNEKPQQTPQEPPELACEGAPETFEVFQGGDAKSKADCDPLKDPNCCHDDKLPAVTGYKGYSSDDT